MIRADQLYTTLCDDFGSEKLLDLHRDPMYTITALPPYMSYEISANRFIELQTKQIEREFKCSKPRPRNKAMGFKGSDKPKHRNTERVVKE